MELGRTEVNVDVYHLDVGGINGTWLWDFGMFTLVGTESFPLRKPDNMNMFSSVVSGVDAECINNMTPEREETVTVFEGDYSIYVETTEGNAGYVISPDGIPYYIIESDVVDDEKTYLVVYEEFSGDSMLVDEDNIDDWVFTLKF